MSENNVNERNGSSLMRQCLAEFKHEKISNIHPDMTLCQLGFNGDFTDFYNYLEQRSVKDENSDDCYFEKPYLVLEAQMVLNKKLQLSSMFIGTERPLNTVRDLMRSSLGVLMIRQ